MVSRSSRIVSFIALTVSGGLAHAAEWAVSPVFSWTADMRSNRTLTPDAADSQAIGAGLDLEIARRSETSEFTLVPHYTLQRFSGDSFPDIDDQRLDAALNYSFEHAALSLGAQYANESTLTSELAETGVVLANARRRTDAASAAWRLFQSEDRRLDVSGSFQKIDYTGEHAGQLFGYRYGSLSATENFTMSPRVVVSVTGYGTQLESPERGSDSREQGASFGVNFAWSERTQLSATLGKSRRDIEGDKSTGTIGSFNVTRKAETREYSLDLSHSLVPMGTGVLTERDSAQLSLTQDLRPRLRALVRAGYARNREAGFGYTFDSRSYQYADLEFRWQLAETWFSSLVTGYASARALDTQGSIGGWNVVLRMSWAPVKRVFGH